MSGRAMQSCLQKGAGRSWEPALEEQFITGKKEKEKEEAAGYRGGRPK